MHQKLNSEFRSQESGVRSQNEVKWLKMYTFPRKTFWILSASVNDSPEGTAPALYSF